MAPEQLEGIAIWLEQNHPATGDAYIPVLEAASILKAYAAGKRERVALWSYDSMTRTLTAADPGATSPRRMTDVPDFAAHVPAVLDCVGVPHRVTWWGESASRAAVNAQRYRLVKRLEDSRAEVLPAAVRAILLEQVGGEVYARYEPMGLPVRVKW